jgi:hypothetical protein
MRIKANNAECKNVAYCHCEPERSEGVAISNLTGKIALAASLPRSDFFHLCLYFFCSLIFASLYEQRVTSNEGRKYVGIH